MKEKLVVWLIDDDDISKYVMKRKLKELSIKNVVDFPDSVEPLEILHKSSCDLKILPDLILLDINMPLIDGFQFLDTYRGIKHKVKKDIPIYMLSSSLNPNDELRAKSFPEVLDYHIKPVAFEALQQMIETVVQEQV
ncbi:response regulator [Maribacter sp. X9]|uniref:response regulator n=1 Tax=Maribacter sp. X9 TaxID=3402159 RepID=UPI003AF36641